MVPQTHLVPGDLTSLHQVQEREKTQSTWKQKAAKDGKNFNQQIVTKNPMLTMLITFIISFSNDKINRAWFFLR